jgi:predicted metal-dependent hydrolase
MKWNEAKGMQRYPEPYIEYLVYFHTDRDFFECHEVLEEYWKSVPDSPLRTAWHGLIQTAVGLYHHRRGNLAGARIMLESALVNLTVSHLQDLGFNSQKFIDIVRGRLKQLSEEPERNYVDLNLPLADAELLQLCIKHAAMAHKNWLAQSDMANLSLIHKHTLRDRSKVIQERQKQLAMKQANITGDEAQ